MVDIAEVDCGSDFDAARVRLFLPRDHAEQRGLARAIGPDDADDATWWQFERQVLDQQPVTIGFVETFNFNGGVAQPLSTRNNDLRRMRLHPRLVDLEQLVIGLDAGLGFRLPRRWRFAHPFGFAFQHFLPRRILARFLRKALGFLAEIGRVVALIGNAAPAIQFQNPARHIVEEVAVMGHDQHGAGVVGQMMFKPVH